MNVEISVAGVEIGGDFFSLPQETFCEGFDFGELGLPRVKTRGLVVVANVRKTVLRVAPFVSDRAPTREERWRLIEENFPLGEKMNSDSYVFDSSVFSNESGQLRLFMTALPVAVSDAIAKIGAAIAGNICRVARLDTVEHIAFRKYASEASEPTLIFLPQEGGIRILHMADNLPVAAHYISNDPAHREGEFLRFFESLEVPPARFVFENDNGAMEWINAFRAGK